VFAEGGPVLRPGKRAIVETRFFRESGTEGLNYQPRFLVPVIP